MVQTLKPILPMLAKTGSLDDISEWGGSIIEPKLDGVRCLVVRDGATTRLFNRQLVDITQRFPEVSLSMAARNCILDGELVCFDSKGNDKFQLVQTRANRLVDIRLAAETNPATFKAFDILHLNDVNVTGFGLRTRRVFLGEVLGQDSIVHAISTNEALAMSADGRGEGVMVKNVLGAYHPGVRTADWLKVKWLQETTVYVRRLIPGIGKREKLGALRVYDSEGKDMGKVGTGFTDEDISRILEIESIGGLPGLPIKVRYDSLTGDGKLRFPRFIGFLE